MKLCQLSVSANNSTVNIVEKLSGEFAGSPVKSAGMTASAAAQSEDKAGAGKAKAAFPAPDAHEGQRRIASSLANSGALRPGLAESEAAHIIHALASPELHGLLVSDRGWTSEQHEKWLAGILVVLGMPIS